MPSDVPSKSPNESEILELQAYVSGSKYRELIVQELTDGVKRPSHIADSRGVARSHVSRALKELQDCDIVQSYGTDTRARLYALTHIGDLVAERISDSNK